MPKIPFTFRNGASLIIDADEHNSVPAHLLPSLMPAEPKGLRTDHHRMKKVSLLRKATKRPLGILRSPVSGSICFYALHGQNKATVWMGNNLASGFTMSIETFKEKYARKVIMEPEEVEIKIKEGFFA